TAIQKRVCTTSDGKVWADAADGVFVQIGSGFTGTAVWTFAVFNGFLYMVNDVENTLQQYDQTTFAAVTGSAIPKCAFIILHKNKLWAAGDPAKPSRLYYSKDLDATVWNSADAGSMDIVPDDGDGIRGLASWQNQLFV